MLWGRQDWKEGERSIFSVGIRIWYRQSSCSFSPLNASHLGKVASTTQQPAVLPPIRNTPDSNQLGHYCSSFPLSPTTNSSYHYHCRTTCWLLYLLTSGNARCSAHHNWGPSPGETAQLTRARLCQQSQQEALRHRKWPTQELNCSLICTS